jgi:hypothetical protein
LRKHGATFRPQVVVFVANLANDWFESAPNSTRWTAQDGWAQHKGGPPPRAFPGRAWLFERSHLVMGLRQVWWTLHGTAEEAPDQMALHLKSDLARLRAAAPDHSLITPFVRQTVEVCAALGCRVVVAVLPLDVQVSAAEWQKTGHVPVDLHDTEVLLDDLVTDTRAMGVPTVNLMEPLRAVEPGAFLDDDDHLSPKGHRVVAEALLPVVQAALAAVPPVPH